MMWFYRSPFLEFCSIGLTKSNTSLDYEFKVEWNENRKKCYRNVKGLVHCVMKLACEEIDGVRCMPQKYGKVCVGNGWA